jgi:hypothetical protein
LFNVVYDSATMTRHAVSFSCLRRTLLFFENNSPNKTVKQRKDVDKRPKEMYGHEWCGTAGEQRSFTKTTVFWYEILMLHTRHISW